MSFKQFNLIDDIMKAVEYQGYTTPTPIQEKAIPIVLDGNDVLAAAQTGTGKTASFTLPLLQQLQKQPPSGKRRIRALVLTPTRELAAQVHDNIVELARYLDLKSTVIFGGVSEKPQISTLNKGVDILIATPGRLLDLHSRGFCSFDALEFFVLDEADRMLDMGFIHDIKKISKLLPPKRQSLFFQPRFQSQFVI